MTKPNLPNMYPDGTQFWYVNGKLHREDGPAAIYPDGTQCWYRNGERHREDGPAFIGSNGWQECWLNGKNVESLKTKAKK